MLVKVFKDGKNYEQTSPQPYPK